MRWLLAFAAALLLAGCGAATPEQAGAPGVPDAPAPAIVAVNETPPDDVLWSLQDEFGQNLPAGDSSGSDLGGSVGICKITSMSDLGPPPPDPNSCAEPSAEELAQIRAEEERYQEAIRPAAGSAPRVVARLGLGGGDVLLFTAWRNGSGALCWRVDESGPDWGGSDGPSGPCTQKAQSDGYLTLVFGVGAAVPSCEAICLSSVGGSSDGAAESYLLSGTVALDAEAIRVTFAGGTTATYPLVGPQVLDSDQRVFLLDLGVDDWRKLELIRAGAVAETAQIPAYIAAYEDCTNKIGPPPQPSADADMQAMTDALQPYDTALTECVRASGAPGLPVLPQAHLP